MYLGFHQVCKYITLCSYKSPRVTESVNRCVLSSSYQRAANMRMRDSNVYAANGRIPHYYVREIPCIYYDQCPARFCRVAANFLRWELINQTVTHYLLTWQQCKIINYLHSYKRLPKQYIWSTECLRLRCDIKVSHISMPNKMNTQKDTKF